jgi:hypothetical protein
MALNYYVYYVHDLGNGNVRIVNDLPSGAKVDGFTYRQLIVKARSGEPMTDRLVFSEEELPHGRLLDVLQEQVIGKGFAYELVSQVITNADTEE